jgi:hypothetical protein
MGVMENYYEDEYSTMWIEDGIGFQVYKPELKITLDVAKKMVEKRVEAFKGVARPVCVDIRNLLTIDNPSRKYFASKEAGQLILAGAIYLNSPITKWVGNVFMLVDKPVTPARLFTDENKAIEWLRKFKNLDSVSVRN